MKPRIVKSILWIASSLLIISQTSGQDRLLTDSLNHILQKTADPSEKIDLLLEIAFLQTDEDPLHADDVLSTAEQIAISNDLKSKLAEVWKDRGIFFGRTSSYNEALKYSFKADSLFDAIDDNYGRSLCFSTIAIIYTLTGEFDSSELYYKKILPIKLIEGDSKSIVSTYTNIAILKRDLNQFDSASFYLFKALQIGEKNKFEENLMNIYYHLSRNLSEQKDYKESYKYAYKLLHLSQKQKNTYQLGLAYQILGDLESYTDGDSAEFYYKEAYTISTRLGNDKLVSTALIRLSNLAQQKNDYKAVVLYLKEAARLIREQGDLPDLNDMLTKLAIAYVSLGQHSEALSIFAECENILNTIDYNHGLNKLYEAKVHYFGSIGKYDSLSHYFQLYEELRESREESTTAEEVSKWQVKYETEQKEQEIKQLESEAAIQALEIRQRNIFVIFATLGITLAVIISVLYGRQNKLKALQKEAHIEQRLLRTQMNPHFIFNALTSIEKYIYDSNINQAAAYLSSFAKLMRRILENSRMNTISLTEEVETLKNYLDIQKLRFDDRLAYEIHVDAHIDLEEVHIPPMFAQPLIENSIEHGIMHKSDKGIIKVFFKLNGDYLNLVVEDNGIGKEMALRLKEKSYQSLATTISSERIALLNRRNRMKTSFELSDIFNEASKVIGTRAVFSFPING